MKVFSYAQIMHILNNGLVFAEMMFSDGLLERASAIWSDEERLTFLTSAKCRVAPYGFVTGENVRVRRIAAMRGIGPKPNGSVPRNIAFIQMLLGVLTAIRLDDEWNVINAHDIMAGFLGRHDQNSPLAVAHNWYYL